MPRVFWRSRSLGYPFASLKSQHEVHPKDLGGEIKLRRGSRLEDHISSGLWREIRIKLHRHSFRSPPDPTPRQLRSSTAISTNSGRKMMKRSMKERWRTFMPYNDHGDSSFLHDWMSHQKPMMMGVGLRVLVKVAMFELLTTQGLALVESGALGEAVYLLNGAESMPWKLRMLTKTTSKGS
jgi:hypothetical protein